MSAFVEDPSKITFVNSVAALSTVTNSRCILNLSSNFFLIIGPGPQSETKES